MVGYEARRREGGVGVVDKVVGLIYSLRVISLLLGWAVIWNLITQTALYP
jgi:hypothetical protein